MHPKKDPIGIAALKDKGKGYIANPCKRPLFSPKSLNNHKKISTEDDFGMNPPSDQVHATKCLIFKFPPMA